MRAFISFMRDTFKEFGFVIDSLSKYTSNLILFITPYFMFWRGVIFTDCSFKQVCKECWVILLVPIAMMIIASFIKYYANMIGKGDMCPIPVERFTEIDEENGIVSIDNSRVQEMILYVGDVEEFLKRKGYL